jgi:hypothetical protein
LLTDRSRATPSTDNQPRYDLRPAPWHAGTFKYSKTYIESLEGELRRATFGIFVLTPSDVAYIREKEHAVPRDNVLFELGLFMGRLGRERCYLVHGEQATKLPSDLLGVQAITYPSARPLEEALIRPVDGILARIAELEAERRHAFCARFEGYWWERLHTKQGKEIAFFRAIADESLTRLTFVQGQHFGHEGRKIGDWKGTRTGYNEDELEIVYSWEGRHLPRDDGSRATVQGFGTIQLVPADGPFREGTGGFIDVDPGRVATTQWKEADLRRLRDAKQVRTMTEESEPKRSALARAVLEDW